MAIVGALALGGLCLTAVAAERVHMPRLAPGVAQRIGGLQGRLGPRTRDFVGQEAAKIVARGGFSLLQVRMDIESADLAAANGGDIDALVQLALLQAAVDEESDLRGQINAMQAALNQKKAMREAGADGRRNGQTLKTQSSADYARLSQAGSVVAPVYNLDSAAALSGLDDRIAADQDDLDSLGTLGEMQQLRLQMLMDRRAKILELLSNLMKAASDTSAAIAGNLK
jgi:hypothetical protein